MQKLRIRKPRSFHNVLKSYAKGAINGAFKGAIMPNDPPHIDWKSHVNNPLFKTNVKGITPCFYCEKSVATCWDHFNAVSEKKGFINRNTIENLVPACHMCNASKGNKHWEAWMNSEAYKKNGIQQRKKEEIKEKIKSYEQTLKPNRIHYERRKKSNNTLKKLDNQLEGKRKEILKLLDEAQIIASKIRAELERKKEIEY